MAKGPLNVPICTVQVACDGNNARAGKNICGACAEKMRKQQKPSRSLRGSNYYAASERPESK